MKKPLPLLLTGFLFLLACATTALRAQNETTKWYFGENAALDFMTNPPTVIATSAMNIHEGCASIADAAGNLLFYASNTAVYNQANSIMANGTGLAGDSSTTQALIVKKPGSATIYYVFTVDAEGWPNGLMYSEVDMSLAAGMGSVTVKNSQLYTAACEKLAAVKHCNGIDIWVLSHEVSTNNFRAYLVTAAGISANPVISGAGYVVPFGLFPQQQTFVRGQMKISPNGRKIGLAVNHMNTATPVEIYDFDPSTGIVSNPLTLGNFVGNYGCEFSPDGTKFYSNAMNIGKIMQWNLCAGSNAAIVASTYTFYAFGSASAMQLAPNGKIYISTAGPILSVINNPNGLGAACGFVANGMSLFPGKCRLGLPSFMGSYFRPASAPFTYSIMNCGVVSFSAPPSPTSAICSVASSGPVGQTWFFGEPTSGAADTSALANPTHVYAAAGTYTVKMVQGCSDTVRTTITITNASPQLSITGIFSICKGEQRLYSVSGASTYTWNNGSIAPIISVSPSVTTVYTVTGTGTNTCKSSSMFTVNVSKCVGLEALSPETQLPELYPNPNNGQLYVKCGSTTNLTICDQLGKVIFEKTLEEGKHPIDISHLGNGLYTVRSVTKKSTGTQKLVKLE